MAAKLRISEQKTKQKDKKIKRSKENLYFFLFLLHFLRKGEITFRGSRQKQLTSYDLWRDVQPKRGDHSWWPFSRGSRACLRDGDCAAEMFSSLLFLLFICYFFNDLGCKSTHFF
jgi:hypothetical protein